MHPTFKKFISESTTNRYTKDSVFVVLGGYIEGGPFNVPGWLSLTTSVVDDMMNHKSYYNRLFERDIFFTGVGYRTIGVPFRHLLRNRSTQELLSHIHRHHIKEPHHRFFSWTRNENLRYGNYDYRTHVGVVLEGNVSGVYLPEIFLFESPFREIKKSDLNHNVVVNSIIQNFNDPFNFIVRHENVMDEDEVLAPKNSPLSIHEFNVKHPGLPERHFKSDEFKELLNYIDDNL